MNKDPGYEFSNELRRILEGLEFLRDGSDTLMGSLSKLPETEYYIQTFPRFELPSDIEEIYTLRKDRFQVFVISGLHETDHGFLSLVAVSQPLMGWEVRSAINDMENDRDPPPWAADIVEDVLTNMVDHYRDEPTDLSHETRLYYPALVEEMDDPEGEPEKDKRRQEALKAILEVLCKENGFKLHSSESGDIPKEVPDEWISPTTLWIYDQALKRVSKELGKEPEDPQLLFVKASLKLSRDRSEEALELLDKAIELSSTVPHYWFARSTALFKLARENEALEAEEKALAIQREVGIAPSRADLYSFLDPFIYNSEDLGPRSDRDENDMPIGPDGVPMQCGACRYDFLHVTEGLEYECNRCGLYSIVMGAAMTAEIEVEAEEIMDEDPIWIRIALMNRTQHSLVLRKDEFEFVIDKDDDDEFFSPMGKLKDQDLNPDLKPGGTYTMRLDLRELEWKVFKKEYKMTELELDPGTYKLDLWVGVQVGPEDKELGSATEADAVTFRIIGRKEDD